MTWMWTWGGRCFGYREGNDLWTHDGKHVGRFYRDEVYGPDAAYLGEVMNGDRLITHRSKGSWRQAGFAQWGSRGAYARYADYVGYAMYAGFEYFPSPDQF